MCVAWRHNPAERPTFNEIIEILIPDLNPAFKENSFFFSEENQANVDMGHHHSLNSSDLDDGMADDSRTPLTRSPKVVANRHHHDPLTPVQSAFSEQNMELNNLSDIEQDLVDIESQSDLSYDSHHSHGSHLSHNSSSLLRYTARPSPNFQRQSPVGSLNCYHDDVRNLGNGCSCSSVEITDAELGPKLKPHGSAIGSASKERQWSPAVARQRSSNSIPSPTESAINSNEGSKGSSKSGSSGTNGYVANGRVKMIAPMNC